MIKRSTLQNRATAIGILIMVLGAAVYYFFGYTNGTRIIFGLIGLAFLGGLVWKKRREQRKGKGAWLENQTPADGTPAPEKKQRSLEERITIAVCVSLIIFFVVAAIFTQLGRH
jgi:hypothetical protein